MYLLRSSYSSMFFNFLLLYINAIIIRGNIRRWVNLANISRRKTNRIQSKHNARRPLYNVFSGHSLGWLGSFLTFILARHNVCLAVSRNTVCWKYHSILNYNRDCPYLWRSTTIILNYWICTTRLIYEDA